MSTATKNVPVAVDVEREVTIMNIIKTAGIDSLKLSIPLNKKLYLNNFKFGAKRRHCSEVKGGTISGFQDDIVVSWPENIRQYYLPEVHFVDYPHHIRGRCYEYQIWIPSLPKLMYGNNITEIPEGDFEKVINQLYRELTFLELPVEITKQDLRNAIVRRVDYGKNIILRDGANMTLLNEYLRNIRIPKRNNYGKTQFYNGELFRSCIKSRAFIIYDKLADYKVKENNSRPAYPNNDLGFNVNKVAQNTNLIRVEVQIQTAKQLKIELGRLGHKTNGVSFKDLFQSDIARDVLARYWEQINHTNRRMHNSSLIDSVSVMYRFNQITGLQKNGPTKTFGMLGFNLFVDTCGLETVHSSFTQRIPTGKWSLTEPALTVELDNKDELRFLSVITEGIQTMQRLTAQEVEDDSNE